MFIIFDNYWMDRNLNIKLSSEESKYQKELLHFKQIESNLNEKYSDSINDLKLRLKDYDNKFDNVNKKNYGIIKYNFKW